MRKLLFCIFISITFINLINAEDTTDSFFSYNNTPLSSEDIYSAFEVLGLNLYRLTFKIADNYQVNIYLQHFLNGHCINNYEYNPLILQPSKSFLNIIQHDTGDFIAFTLKNQTLYGSSQTYNINKENTGYSSLEYNYNCKLQLNKKIPIYLWRANPIYNEEKDSPGFDSEKNLDIKNVISNNKLVVIIFAELVESYIKIK